MEKPYLDSDYLDKIREQLGEHWQISSDASLCRCGNLSLRWLPEFWTWGFYDNDVQISRFIIPFEPQSLVRFKGMCSRYYKAN